MDIRPVINELVKREADLDDELKQIVKARRALEALLPPEVSEPEAKKPPKQAPKAKAARRKKRKWRVDGPWVRAEEIRDWIVEVGVFTRQDMANKFGRGTSWTQNALKPFLEKGVVAPLAVSGGRSQEFEYVTPNATPNRARSTGPVASAGKGTGGPVPGTGKARMGTKDMRPMLAAARQQGFKVDQDAGHITVKNEETKESRKISCSPSDRNAHKKVKRELVQMGVTGI